jgi:hypothetical protein
MKLIDLMSFVAANLSNDSRGIAPDHGKPAMLGNFMSASTPYCSHCESTSTYIAGCGATSTTLGKYDR